MKKISGILALLFIGFHFTPLHAEGVAVGSKAPDFSLTDTNGKSHKLSDFAGKTVVLEWTNFGCPFVKKHYNTGNMQALQKKWTAQQVVWLSICSSGKGNEGNLTAAEWNKAIVDKKAASTAYLIDEDGKVGHAYGAKTTPHLFVINAAGNLVYKGAIDEKPSTKESDVTGAKNFVDLALTEMTAGKQVSISVTDSYGCSVKYAK